MKINRKIKQLDKMNVVKIAVLVLVMIAVETVAAITVYFGAVSVALNGIYDGYSIDMKRVAEEFNEILENDYNGGAPYDIDGSLSGDDLTLDYAGESFEYKISHTIKPNIENKKINFYELSEMIDNPSKDEFIVTDKHVYAVYTKNETGTELYFRDVETLISALQFRSFEGVAIFSDSRRAVFVTTPELKRYLEYNLIFSKQNVETKSAKLGENNYALSLSPLADTDFYLGAYADFAKGDEAVTTLGNQVLITTGILVFLTILLLGFGIYLSGGTGTRKEYAYKITVDSEGKIIKANRDFKEDYPETTVIKERVNHFSENEFYALSVKRGEADDILVCGVNKRTGGTISLNASRLTIPFGAAMETERSNDTMEDVYRSYSQKNKQVLVGDIFMVSMHDIKTVFGKDFSDKAQAIIIEKIRERFQNVFPLDVYHIGILMPEGKQMQAAQRDLAEIVDYLNRALYVDEILINVKVKCGFSLVDKTMEDRSFDYALGSAEAALKRTMEETSDAASSKNFYLYHEDQKKLYSRYFLKIDVVKMLEQGDFEMQYQPQYSMKRGRIVAFEAL
ncbi:MAG: hypothetical protein J6Z34_06530, partial [Clostridia bacterium]|nr:hypothetical protein [Clostridia bacterium]